MITQEILCCSLVLLYRENLLNQALGSSGDLVKEIIQLDRDSIRKRPIGMDSNFMSELTNLIISYINHPEDYDKTTLLDTLEIIYKDRLDQFPTIEKSINAELTPDIIKKSIVTLRNRLMTFQKEYTIKNLINKMHREINIMGLKTDTTITQKALELIGNLESHVTSTEGKDQAIIDEIDMGSEESLKAVTEKVTQNAEAVGLLKTGWKQLNIMTQGGFRRGEMWMINALPHNYKSGLLQSLFVQFCIHNEPKLTDPTKKPVIMYISFEDNSDIYTEFMFKYLYCQEFDKIPNMKEISKTDMGAYISKRLTEKGYYAITMRVDPLKWSIRDLMNKIISYESSGYEIHACILDYLSKMPTTGCDHTGPGGTDMRDMFQRCRQFFTSRGTLCITAHQLDTVSRLLIKQDKNELEFSSANISRQKEFVKEVAGKGYTEISKQLDQIVDGEICIHIVREKEKSVLTMKRGKHRYPGLLREDDKYQELEFLPQRPPRENLNDPDEIEKDQMSNELGF